MTAFNDHVIPTGAELETALRAHPSAGVSTAAVEPALEEKIHYLFTQAKRIETLIDQAGPLLEQAGPLLATFGGQASSPLGRIAGAFLR